MALPPPTDDVARFVELLGEDAALKLFETRGGVRIYVSAPVAGNAVVELLGLDAAAALHDKFGSHWLKVPIARAWRVLCYVAQGDNNTQAALRAGCGLNTVQDILARFGHPHGRKPPMQTSQLDLFRQT